VFFGKKNKEQERFYLFPGQGGKNFQRKQKLFLTWTIIASLCFGIAMALVMWWTTRLKQ
jgi:hypothetical protein